MSTIHEKYNSKPKVLVVEDDITIAKIIEYNLVKAGYIVSLVHDGDHVIDYAKSSIPYIILVDWILPGLQGTTICKLLRSLPETANIPIIMISSKDGELDKVDGLDHGADDYIGKPIAPIEMLARIKAILRRTRPSLIVSKIQYRNIEIDLYSYDVLINNQKVKLSPIEFQVLKIFVEYPKKVFTREDLIRNIWSENDDVCERTLDVHISRLRKHLLKYGMGVIHTIRGIGYKME